MALSSNTDKILLTFVSISVPFYILFLFTIIINRKKEPFNSHFFKLTLSLGIADLAAVLHSYFFIRFPGWGWLQWFYVENGQAGSFLASYAMSMQFGLSLSQHTGVLLISINRLSRLVLQESTYERIWTRNNFLFAIFLYWFLPAILCASMMPQCFYYWGACYDTPEGCTANIDFCNITTQEIYYGIALGINFLVNILSFSSYAVIFVLSLKHTMKRLKIVKVFVSRSQSTLNPNSIGPEQIEDRDRNNRNSTRRDLNFNYMREMKLAISGFAVFIAMVVYFTFLAYIAATSDFTKASMWYIASDVFSCINPYTLLLMSNETRRQFLKLIQFWKK